MNLTLSPQIKLVALVGVLAALALGAGSMLLSRSQKVSASSASTVARLPQRGAPVAAHDGPAAYAAARHAALAKHAAAAKHAAPARHPAPVKHNASPAPRNAPTPAIAASGLPAVLDILLHGHSVVVVSLYDPEVEADGIALAEARAGAKDAHAGFLAVNVLDGRVTGPLTSLAGGGTVLPDPGILIYRQPGTLMNRIDGFSDRAAVAQAVASALVADPPSGS